jgi:hypothetical protein
MTAWEGSNEAISAGDTTLTDEKNDVENSIDFYEDVEEDIVEGRIRIDEVYGDWWARSPFIQGFTGK